MAPPHSAKWNSGDKNKLDILSNLTNHVVEFVMWLFLPFLLAAVLLGMVTGHPERILTAAFQLAAIFVGGVFEVIMAIYRAIMGRKKPGKPPHPKPYFGGPGETEWWMTTKE